jgi:F-type H+-transporting ATPase subunit delta
MRDTIVSKIYADALFKEARKTNILEQVTGDMRAFRPILSSRQLLRRFFEAPQISNQEKIDFAQRMMEGQVSNLVQDFITILLRKRRIGHITEIIDLFLDMVDKELGIQEVQVITAIKLSDELRQQLGEKLELITQKKIRMKNRVDPHIIGGVIVNFHNTMIDGSYRSRLSDIREKLLTVKVYQKES